MQTNNKLILKNTILLYGREIITLFIAFFNSRLLLEQLGVDDFGMYGLIGSILAMFSSLRGLFASSIQRFINMEKGIGNQKNVNRIFSMGIIIHAGLSIIFILVVEGAGLMCIPALNIPQESISAAYWVLQFSILAAVVTLMTVPYDALIIANEKFDAFAIFSIIEIVLKLVIILLLVYSPFQKVIVYSFLVLIVVVVIRSLNAIYCNRVFKETAQFHWVRDTVYMKQMTVFAGWQFFGNLGFSLMNAGMNFLINLFGGVMVNAARTIAYQTMSAVDKFTGSVSVSFQPQSMMLYSQGAMSQYTKLMLMNTKISYAITSILGFVVVMMAPSLLRLWLGSVPNYTIEMVQAIFVYAVVRSLHGPIDILFKAAGKLKYYQLCELILLSANLPLSWVLLHWGYPYYSVFILMAVVEFINLLVMLLLANRLLKFDSMRYIFLIMPRSLFVLALSLSVFFGFSPIVNVGYSVFGTIWKSAIFLVISAIVFSLILFKTEELRKVFQVLPFIKNKKI